MGKNLVFSLVKYSGPNVLLCIYSNNNIDVWTMKMHDKDVEANSGIKECPSRPHGLALNDDPPCLSSPKRNMQVDSKRKHRSSSAPPNEFSSRPNFRGEIFVDALGRERIRWPRSGLLNVFLYASIFHSSTSTMDVCNLKKILGSIVFGKETKGQSLSYMSEDQTGRQSQPQILSILLGCGETLTLIF